MVFVWSNLTDGEPDLTLTQVALNDGIMVFAFAPVVGLLLGQSAIAVAVMLTVVRIAKASNGWFERGTALRTSVTANTPNDK